MAKADPTQERPLRFDVGGGEPLELEGWESLSPEATKRMQQLQFEEQLNRASLYRQCFTTSVGRMVLQDMISTYLGRAIVVPDDDAKADGIRQGQANVVGDILSQIEFANTGGGRSPETEE